MIDGLVATNAAGAGKSVRWRNRSGGWPGSQGVIDFISQNGGDSRRHHVGRGGPAHRGMADWYCLGYFRQKFKGNLTGADKNRSICSTHVMFFVAGQTTGLS